MSGRGALVSGIVISNLAWVLATVCLCWFHGTTAYGMLHQALDQTPEPMTVTWFIVGGAIFFAGVGLAVTTQVPRRRLW